ncbi:MAG: hypothetical protein HC811_13790 [Flammeovirgaceae bacterium]|nr:hypothetical protein [Flammeovirgaceae bacterium]
MTLSKLKKIVLPGIILQSVLIGGGYATGREIVEYGGKFGALGWICGVTIFVGFSVLAILTFEACRQWKVYDYKSLLQKMLGRGWIAYEISYLLLAIIIIAVMASAAGEILNTTMGFNVWVGIVLIILIVGFLNYMGEDFIAKMKTIGTIALFIAYGVFSYFVFTEYSEKILNVFTTSNSNYMDSPPSILLLLWTGILYVGYNLAVYPAGFFTIKEITSKKESVAAGIISGVLMTFPWFLTYFSIMAFYPNPEILNSSVPWLKMLQPFNSTLIIIFGIVVGWTLVETATGMIHGFIARIDQEVFIRKTNHLKKSTKALISIAALLIAMLTAQIGIIDLIANGYAFMAYVMILVFALPLLYYSKRLLFSS